MGEWARGRAGEWVRGRGDTGFPISPISLSLNSSSPIPPFRKLDILEQIEEADFHSTLFPPFPHFPIPPFPHLPFSPSPSREFLTFPFFPVPKCSIIE